jgi:hypothetical protein
MGFKIRVLIGSLFTFIGLALVVYWRAGNAAIRVPWFGISVNGAWGIPLFVLGIVIIILSRRGQRRAHAHNSARGFREVIKVDLRVLLKTFSTRVYFYYWSWKAEIRHVLKVISLFALIGLAVLMGVEVGLEFWGKIWLSDLTKATGFHLSLTIIFVLAVAYVAWHHWSEIKKPNYEYRFAQCLRSIIYGSAGPDATKALLGKIHAVFEDVGISHVCIARPTAGGELVIDREEVYPGEERPEFFYRARIGQGDVCGVSGRVYNDGLVRYVPRLFFPIGKRHIQLLACPRVRVKMMPFPHAVQYRSDADVLVEEKPDYGCVELPSNDDGRVPFLALLSIPLMKSGRNNTVGILNFDFDKVNPLDRSDIELALVIAHTLGQRL